MSTKTILRKLVQLVNRYIGQTESSSSPKDTNRSISQTLPEGLPEELKKKILEKLQAKETAEFKEPDKPDEEETEEQRIERHEAMTHNVKSMISGLLNVAKNTGCSPHVVYHELLMQGVFLAKAVHKDEDTAMQAISTSLKSADITETMLKRWGGQRAFVHDTPRKVQ